MFSLQLQQRTQMWADLKGIIGFFWMLFWIGLGVMLFQVPGFMFFPGDINILGGYLIYAAVVNRYSE